MSSCSLTACLGVNRLLAGRQLPGWWWEAWWWKWIYWRTRRYLRRIAIFACQVKLYWKDYGISVCWDMIATLTFKTEASVCRNLERFAATTNTAFLEVFFYSRFPHLKEGWMDGVIDILHLAVQLRRIHGYVTTAEHAPVENTDHPAPRTGIYYPADENHRNGITVDDSGE